MSGLSLDEIFGDGLHNHKSLSDGSINHSPENNRPKLKVVFKLPLQEGINKNKVKSVLVTPECELIIKTARYGIIRSGIVYENANEQVNIEWEQTKQGIVNRLKDSIKTGELEPITDLILSMLNTERDRINYYISAIPNNGPVDSISEFIENPDESDASDTPEVNKMELLSVSKALKLNSGYINVKGSIVSILEPHKMVQSYKFECYCGLVTREEHFEVPLYKQPKLATSKCNKCHGTNINYDYINAISLELQDDEQFSDIERLDCILLDTDTASIKIGERVEIRGSIHVINKNQKGNLVPVLFSRNLIDYPNKNDTTISELDKDAIKRFALRYGEEVISKLVDMYDKSVIGSDVAKKALLLSLASAGDDTKILRNNKGNRKRMHSLLVGPPGVAKSSLLKKASKLIANSRYESSQHASGKSLTAIVEKENENHSLRLGPIPLAKKSICALNEIGTISFEEQKFLLDPMEEGEFTINKYGINATISSPTTVIASTNLLNSSYDSDSYNGYIQLNQIPCIPPLRDRFDLIVVMSEETRDDAILAYVDKKIENISKRIPNYDSFLQKYLQQAREIEPVFDPNCINRIKYYYFSLKKSNPGLGSNRLLETLFRLGKVIAKLKLKQVIDGKDVEEAIEFYGLLVSKYAESSNVPSEPDKYTYQKCLEILKSRYDSEERSMQFYELLYVACMSDGVVRSYLSDSNIVDINKLKIDKNHKSRQVRDLLVNNSFVRTVNVKPLTLLFDFGLKKEHITN